jgi:SAM-dependent methyltransferase
MNWKIKAHILAVLSRCPSGKAVYQTLQHSLGTDRTSVEEYLARAVNIVELIRESGRQPGGGIYLEIGTGWKPFLPFTLYLLGAERIFTLDINPWLTKDQAFETARILGTKLDVLAQQLGLERSALEQRYQAAMSRAKGLPELLEAFHVDYRCPADARDTGLRSESVDYVVSSNVLEHIPVEVLRAIHRESHRILRPGGLAVHRFNPEDHFSCDDSSITAVNFLRFSERQWRWYGGSGLAYHNRLRCVQHQRLFEAEGFDLLVRRTRMNERALRAIVQGEVPIHADFQGFSPEELAADYMWVVAQRREGA